MGMGEHAPAETVVAEVRMFVSRADAEEGSYRASVFAGPDIGPEDPRLQREEFTGPSLMEAIGPAMRWAERVLRTGDS